MIGTKWVFRNKMDEQGIIVRNKARLVAKGYNQEEGIDCDETYAPVARIEAVRLLLAYAYLSGFKLFQMDVKSAFLNGFINAKYMSLNNPDLKTTNCLDMFTNLRRLSMDLNKLLGNGMKD